MARVHTQGYSSRNRFFNRTDLRPLSNTEARRLAELIYQVAKKVGLVFLK